MNTLSSLLTTLQVQASIFHNGRYCGAWALDASDSNNMAFHVVSQGQCFLLVEQQTISLNTGDAVFFPSQKNHRISNLANESVTLNEATSLPMTQHANEQGTGLVCGHFGNTHPLFNTLLSQMPSFILIKHKEMTASSKIIHLIIQEAKSTDQTSNILLNKLSDCLLYTLFRDHVDAQHGLFAAIAHPKLSKALELIHSQLDTPLDLDRLSAFAGMSRSGFSKLFKQLVNQTPHEYMVQWRMAQAYRWLADEGISTFDAALRSGYESEASFAKAFKRTMKIGPGQARTQYKERY